jgi:hypothetical protein
MALQTAFTVPPAVSKTGDPGDFTDAIRALLYLAYICPLMSYAVFCNEVLLRLNRYIMIRSFLVFLAFSTAFGTESHAQTSSPGLKKPGNGLAYLSTDQADRLLKDILAHSRTNVDTIKRLLSYGAAITTTDSSGWTVLHSAVAAGDTALVRKSLNAHIAADGIFTSGTERVTPLYLAVKNGQSAAEGLLRQIGATFGIGDGNGTQEYAEGNRYTGNFSNGERTGNGTFEWVNGEKYEGNWEHGEMAGNGTFYWANKDRYEGTFTNGHITGTGSYFFANGNRYEGPVKDGTPLGDGILYAKNGDVYEGHYENGARNGYGKMTWANCDRYIGHFANNRQSGKGIMYYTNGDWYDGEWKDDLENGNGVFHWANGNMYAGQFAGNKLSGRGAYYWQNGEKYEGQYKNNIRGGEGTYTWPTGEKYVGQFADNMKQGKGTFYWKNGDKYSGDWKNDRKNGSGTFRWKNGDRYEGGFIDDARNGYGVYVVTSSNSKDFIRHCKYCKTYRGYWKNGRKDGNGSCYGARGKLIYSGPFAKDKPLKRYPSKK